VREEEERKEREKREREKEAARREKQRQDELARQARRMEAARRRQERRAMGELVDSSEEETTTEEEDDDDEEDKRLPDDPEEMVRQMHEGLGISVPSGGDVIMDTEVPMDSDIAQEVVTSSDPVTVVSTVLEWKFSVDFSTCGLKNVSLLNYSELLIIYSVSFVLQKETTETISTSMTQVERSDSQITTTTTHTTTTTTTGMHTIFTSSLGVKNNDSGIRGTPTEL